MSKTVMLSEVLSWTESNDQGAPVSETVAQGNDGWRGVWMIPGMGASAFSGRFPPNSTGTRADFRKASTSNSADKIPACGTGLDVMKNANGLHADAVEIPCTEDQETGNTWASARSKHNEGVNAAMGDGSVQFVGDDIDAFVWHAMCTRAGNEAVDR